MNIKLRSFASKIAYFNGMYQLPIAASPTTDAEAQYQSKFNSKENPDESLSTGQLLTLRCQAFKKIMLDEVDEISDIILSLQHGCKYKDGLAVINADGTKIPYGEVAFLVDMADWLGDLTIYCASEAQRYGLDMQQVLNLIMQSNFSKLGADGKPIIAEGKVQKGPNFFPPEPALEEYIRQAQADKSVYDSRMGAME